MTRRMGSIDVTAGAPWAQQYEHHAALRPPVRNSFGARRNGRAIGLSAASLGKGHHASC